METPQVRIVKLEAMRVICFNGYGESPEELALEKQQAWAASRNHSGRIFGFNNPSPSAGSPNYGYEVWMQVAEGAQAEGEECLQDFPGGLYAVLRCPVNKPWDDIPAAWQTLVRWLDGSTYRHGAHQWLEEHLHQPEENAGELFTLDLYLPVSE